MSAEWERLADWWLREVQNDASFSDVVPLVSELAPPLGGLTVLELGCGEGRLLRALHHQGGRVIGCDVNEQLARRAAEDAPVVVGRFPKLDFLRSSSVDVILVVLVLEHLFDIRVLLSEAARVARVDAALVAVLNHPLFTAPDSAPIIDQEDGEFYWRWGAYLEAKASREHLGGHEITFWHRPISEVLNAASQAGWSLAHMLERPVSAPDAPLIDQAELPRLLGVRWQVRRPAG